LPGPVPRASVCWGKNRGQREALTYTQEMEGETTNSLVCHKGRKEPISHKPVSGGGETPFFPRPVRRCERWTRLVSLEARLNVRAAMEAADLTNLAYTQDADGSAFICHVHSRARNRHEAICAWLARLQQYIFTRFGESQVCIFPFSVACIKKKDLHDILRNTATEQRHY